MSDKKWRIPTITRGDGKTIKAWQPRELDYLEAEFAMKLFNDLNYFGKLKTGIKTKVDIMLVLRDDGGSKQDNLNMLRLIIDTHPIETKASESEMETFIAEVKKRRTT